MKRMIFCVFALLVMSCSVKEDRTDCPCLLEFDFSKCQSLPQDVNISCVRNDEAVFETMAFPKDYRLSKLVAKVPKGEIEVAAWWGPDPRHIQGHRLIVPSGCQGDSLYVHSSLVNCDCDKAADTLRLFKQFANVHVTVGGTGTTELKFLARGNVNGYDLLLHRPLPGDFSWMIEDGSWDFRLPRQMDSSLTFEMFFAGDAMGVLPVGEWIVQSGYCWEDENLDDIALDIDYAECKVRVTVDDWEYGTEFKVEI